MIDLCCEWCDGLGVIPPPAIFGESVPDDACEECPACHGTGREPR